jgi:hypothetical protein
LRQRLAGVDPEFAELCAVVECQQHLAMRPQLGRHDVEQAGIDAEDRDQRLVLPMSLSTPSASPPNCSTRNSISLESREASMSPRSTQPLSNS